MFKFMKGGCLTFKLAISQYTKDLHTKLIPSVLYLLKYIEILTGLPLSSTNKNYIWQIMKFYKHVTRKLSYA